MRWLQHVPGTEERLLTLQHKAWDVEPVLPVSTLVAMQPTDVGRRTPVCQDVPSTRTRRSMRVKPAHVLGVLVVVLAPWLLLGQEWLDEVMSQCAVCTDALLGVQRQHLLKQVRQLSNLQQHSG